MYDKLPGEQNSHEGSSDWRALYIKKDAAAYIHNERGSQNYRNDNYEYEYWYGYDIYCIY